MTGSSPLARGLLDGSAARPGRPGIIPARAGFTRRTSRHPAGSADHPRSRGVYIIAGQDSLGRAGSSPLARGLRRRWWREQVAGRIIPARAGFTTAAGCRRSPTGDHPRSRGVYPGYSPGKDIYHGSSPLARGLRASSATVSARRRDHPRSRGVYVTGRGVLVMTWGSSPLARGLLVGECANRDAGRIIPARAGFTYDLRLLVPAGGDHPRSRGVYVDALRAEGYTDGSSPLARGLHKLGASYDSEPRIIPARAGFTSIGGGSWVLPGDHPRSRGVYAEVIDITENLNGSSPLARGLHQARVGQ